MKTEFQKPKILAIGHPLMIQRLTAKIDRQYFTISGCQDSSQMDNLLKTQKFDMVIVDNLLRDAQEICENASVLNESPVALLLQGQPVNWRNLESSAVDGFLPDNGTGLELMARIRAYMRK